MPKFTLTHLATLKQSGKIRDYSVSEKKEVKRNKYGAKKVEHDGVVYDSKTEYVNHMELLFLQRIGEISNLRRQVTYDLGVCKYIADHVYANIINNVCAWSLLWVHNSMWHFISNEFKRLTPHHANRKDN